MNFQCELFVHALKYPNFWSNAQIGSILMKSIFAQYTQDVICSEFVANILVQYDITKRHATCLPCSIFCSDNLNPWGALKISRLCS